MRISVELVPRKPEVIDRDVRVVDEQLGSVDTINIPDLTRFDLRSWDACAQVRRTVPRLSAIPHVRAQDLDPAAVLPFARALDEAEIGEILIVTGDYPTDMRAMPGYDVNAIQAIRRLRRELPDLTVYAGLDTYRQSPVKEHEYCEAKLDAGAVGFFTQPLFSTAWMEMTADLVPDGAQMWWGVTTVVTDKSRAYWRRRNNVVFPAGFETSMEWHRDLLTRTLDFARERGDNVYAMPVAASIPDWLGGIL